MKSCKKSLEEDIDQGFTFLHLDPCIDIHDEISTDNILDRLFELYGVFMIIQKGWIIYSSKLEQICKATKSHL